MTERPVMYLEHEDWSPRYEDTFYTVRLDHFELFTAPPNLGSLPLPSDLGGKTNFPAYYYKVEVFCGRHKPKVVFRRYSQFKSLYQKMPRNVSSGGAGEEAIPFPPGSCLTCFQNDDFAKNRMEQLRDFLRDVLIRKGVASHEAMAQFLELGNFVETRITDEN